MQTRSDGDVAAAKIDRTIASMRVGESACTILVKSAVSITALSSGPSSIVFTYPEIAGCDEFSSLATQFNMFRVKCMRFEFCHVNPSNQTPIVASTVHSNLNGAIPTGWTTEQSVIDGPDSVYLTPGAVKDVLYWNGNSSTETEYQDVSSFNNHGGVRVYVPGVTTTTTHSIMVVSAVVIFKGRK